MTVSPARPADQPPAPLPDRIPARNRTTIRGRVRRILTGSFALACLAVTGSALVPGSAAAQDTGCGRLAHCSVVDHADVDGDGRRDTIAVAPRMVDRDGIARRVIVRVRTAKGSVLRRSLAADWVPASALYRGAAPIDGERGAELVITHQLGAHTGFYRVLAERGGRLVTVPAPEVPGFVPGGPYWVTDGSLASTSGIYRSKRPGSPPVLTLRSGSRDLSQDRLSGRSTSYRWRHGSWTRIGSVRQHWTPERAGTISGWHLRGLGTGI